MNIPSRDNLIFFTDLDGTLLDHETYSYDPALEALRQLRKHNIPLILASSKTAAEIEPLRLELGFSHCEAIIENGAGILFSDSAEAISGDIYANVLDKLSNVPSEYRDKFLGFSDCSIEELSELTGLTKNSASLAKDRQFSEPGVWSGSEDELEVFCALLEEQGIVGQKGGRFLTLSFRANKVDRMIEIAAKHRSGADRPFCVALGDAPNDISMLETADIGIVIPNPSHKGVENLAHENAKIIYAPYSGPKGWNIAVLDVLHYASLGENIG